MKKQLDAQRAEIEEKRRQLEDEIAQWQQINNISLDELRNLERE